MTAWPIVREVHLTRDLRQLVIPVLSPGRAQPPAAPEPTTPPLLSQKEVTKHLALLKKKRKFSTNRKGNKIAFPSLIYPLPSYKNQRWLLSHTTSFPSANTFQLLQTGETPLGKASQFFRFLPFISSFNVYTSY